MVHLDAHAHGGAPLGEVTVQGGTGGLLEEGVEPVAPLAVGVVRRVKARLMRRQGAPLLQKTKGDDGYVSFELDPLIPDSTENIVLQAEAGPEVNSVDWYVNGKKIATAHRPDFRVDWKPVIGHARIEARSGNLHDVIDVEVTTNK